MGELLISWTVRLALICWTAATGMLVLRMAAALFSVYRLLWTVGAVLFTFHVLAAFHFAHQWSHTAAILHTAEETEKLIGWRFGEGLWFSYLFVALWATDAADLWLRPGVRRDNLHSRSYLGMQLYLWFIAFNGAVIFESGVTRIPGIIVTLILSSLIIAARIRTRGGAAVAMDKSSACEEQ